MVDIESIQLQTLMRAGWRFAPPPRLKETGAGVSVHSAVCHQRRATRQISSLLCVPGEVSVRQLPTSASLLENEAEEEEEEEEEEEGESIYRTVKYACKAECLPLASCMQKTFLAWSK